MTAKGATRLYAAANLEAARIIAADPKYAGLMREWAELVLKRAQPL